VRVLVTNDDGVESPGIRALARAVNAAGHEVVVVAPSGERSGSGAATGRLHRSGPIPWTVVEWHDLPGLPVHAVETTPAGAVYAAVFGAFGPRPDVVVAGVNPGLNYGHLALHSGTVGAGLTACLLGIPAVAASISWDGDHQHWDTAATLAARALEWAVGLAVPAVVNVNVANIPPEEVVGVAATVPAPYGERWTARTRPGELLMTYEGREPTPDTMTDVRAIELGMAAITVLTGLGCADATAVAARLEAALPTTRAAGDQTPEDLGTPSA
jgi:5'/3'-nucleotidase